MDGRMDGPTDRRTHPLIEMRGRIQKLLLPASSEEWKAARRRPFESGEHPENAAEGVAVKVFIQEIVDHDQLHDQVD